MRRLLPLVLLAASIAAAPAVSAEPPVLDQPRHGADAVRALGDALPAVAREHQTTAAELRSRLQRDLSLWVDVDGRLFYVDPAPGEHGDEHGHVEESEPATAGTTAALTESQVLALSSKPDAARTVLLDVDGFGGDYGGSVGSAWDPGYTGGDGVAEPYDRDGRVDTFSAEELADIHSIWQRVAEDFAPFDVNVTTKEPSDPGVIDRSDSSDQVYGTRVAITSTATDCRCGGVAYVGVFDQYGNRYPHSRYQPAFVYNQGAKYAAEAASHEAGHNLGLNHDGAPPEGYYAGHGDWAPIMGVGYYKAISQWSRGEYSGADNLEDDFAVAGSNGAPLRGDDHGTGTSATPLSGVAEGVMETRSDVDDFAFSISAGTEVTVSVTPAGVSPNLDVRATLRTVDGAEVAWADPVVQPSSTDVALGLDAAFSAAVTAGETYVLSVEGVGFGDPLSSGYSDYGSVGAYSVSVTGAGLGAPVFAPAEALGAPSELTASVEGATVRLAWTAGTGAEGYELQRAKQGKGGAWSEWSTLASTTGTAYDDNPGSGTFRYQVRSVRGTATSGWSNEATAPIAKTSNKPQRTR